MPAHVPARMHHPRAEIAVTTDPRVIGPGMAVLPPLPRMLFWLGYVTEQALVVNVRGFGLVLISGCGHPRIEQILGITEQVLDIPIRAVVGGLHLPVHAARTPLIPQAVLGNPHPPWHPVSERDAEHVLEEIQARGPRVIALSGHDSTPWTYDAFSRRFGDRYRTLRVGEELRITAADVRPQGADDGRDRQDHQDSEHGRRAPRQHSQIPIDHITGCPARTQHLRAPYVLAPESAGNACATSTANQLSP